MGKPFGPERSCAACLEPACRLDEEPVIRRRFSFEEDPAPDYCAVGTRVPKALQVIE
jgi:hypothetical protein